MLYEQYGKNQFQMAIASLRLLVVRHKSMRTSSIQIKTLLLHQRVYPMKIYVQLFTFVLGSRKVAADFKFKRHSFAPELLSFSLSSMAFDIYLKYFYNIVK